MLGLGQAQINPTPSRPPRLRSSVGTRANSIGSEIGGAFPITIDPNILGQQVAIERLRNAMATLGSRFQGAMPHRADVPRVAGRRARELAWKRANPDLLQTLVGQWVIVEGEDLVAHGPDAAGVAAAARGRGIRVPFMFFVEPTDRNTVKIGL